MVLRKSEAIKCLANNDNISIESVYEARGTNRIVFVAKSDDVHYDSDIAKLVADSYDGEARKILRGIFVERAIPLRLCAAFELVVEEKRINAIADHHFGSEYSEYLPHPYINRFRDMGSFTHEIEWSINNYNLDSAIKLCISCTGYVALADRVLMACLVSDLMYRGTME